MRSAEGLVEAVLARPDSERAARELSEAWKRDPRAVERAITGSARLAKLADECCPPLRHPTADGPRTWRNVARTIVNRPRTLARPRSEPELREIVKRASHEGRRVRPVAAGHSYADITQGDDVLLDMTQFCPTASGLLPTERSTWKDPVPEKPVVRIAAGARIAQLDASLRSTGLGFINLGGYTGQTFVGAASTSTHGSGAQLPPFPDLVRSLDLVVHGGEALRVEPAHGPTAPQRWNAAARGRRLIQDDAAFYSAVVGLGSLGVVTSMLVEVMGAYRLRQRRAESTWSAVRAQLADGRLLSQHRHVEVLVHPYAPTGDHRTLVTLRDLAPPDDATRRDGSHWGRDRNARRPPVRELMESMAALSPFQRLSVTLFLISRSFQDSVLNTSLDTLLDPELMTSESVYIYDLGKPNDAATLSIELEYDFERIVPAVDAFLERAKAFRDEHGWMHTSPLSIRFVRESRARLSMFHGRALSATLEVPLLRATPNGARLLLEQERCAYAHGARPHWGQGHFLTHCDGFLDREYAQVNDWRATKRRFDPRGTFDNHFTDRMGLSTGRRP